MTMDGVAPLMIDNSDLYEQRLLVFLETDAQSNEYYQVILTPEEFKAISALVGQFTGRKEGGLDVYEIQTSEDTYKLPDLQSYEERK